MTPLMRRGFTMVETIVAVALASLVLLPAVFLLLRGVGGVRSRLDSQATTQSLASDLEGLIRRDLNTAAAGLVTTPNTTGLMIRVGGADASATDTLLLVVPTGAPWQVSTISCDGGAGDCVRILGNALDSLPVNSLVHLAAPTIGGRLAQISAADTISEPCGIDCPEQPLSCTESLGAALTRLRVIGSRRVDVGGTPEPVVPNIPCDSTVYGDGDTCQELYAVEPVDTARTLACTAPTTPTQIYTDVTLTDRTAAMGFLTPPIAPPYRSGPRGQPTVSVQGVRVIRYSLRSTVAGTSQLIREIDLENDGSWTPPEVLSNRLTQWRLSTIHATDSIYRRGFQVTAADLAWTGVNANRWNLTGETIPDSTWIGFLKSAASVGGFQLDFTVLPRNAGSQATVEAAAAKPYRVQIALPRLLQGGSPVPGRR